MSGGFEADLAAAPLTVALELRDPFAYLALGPAFDFGRAHDVAITWLPLRAQPLRPPAAVPADADRGARHRSHRANAIAREIAVYADAQGLTLCEPYRDGPAEAARLAWLWVRAHHPERLELFLHELFRRYWSITLDPNDPSALAALVASIDAAPDTFLAWTEAEGAVVLAALDAALAAVGLVGSPSYRVGEEIFRGRQHLPMIAWLLGGRCGAAPI